VKWQMAKSKSWYWWRFSLDKWTHPSFYSFGWEVNIDYTGAKWFYINCWKYTLGILLN
jgi:hypothetical protein